MPNTYIVPTLADKLTIWHKITIFVVKVSYMRRLFFTLFVVITTFAVRAQTLNEGQFATPKPHPRLIIDADRVAQLKRAVATSPQMERLNDYILTRATSFLEQPEVVYKKTGKRLLTISRTVLERVLFCSYAYLVTDDVEYAQRAEQEMIAAARFDNWNPSHFLDVAEMTVALALGYDWLYDMLSKQSREEIVGAIVEKGLLGAEKEGQMWFYRRANNWNQVCNCGMVLGALAVSEYDSELALEMVEKSLLSNPIAMATYAPNGVYVEGSGYWSYGTWFEVLMIEGLRSALGSSFGIEDSEGFLQSADFVNFMMTPTGGKFNYSDNGATVKKAQNPLLGWFAAESGDMGKIYDDFRSLEGGAIRIEERRLLPIGMFFLSRCNLNNIEPPKSNFFVGGGTQPLFAYRSGWNSKKDIYLAAKGGSASLSHAHMDAGSFIYEWGGVRWSIDLGSQNYYTLERKGVDLWNMKENSQRWDVFRIGSSAHSTLTVKDKKHLVAGRATMVESYDSKGCHGATFDMSQLFEELSVAMRTITIDDYGRVAVIDSLQAVRPTTMRWTMCTNAEVELLGNREILLKQSGKRLLICASKGAKAFTVSNTPPHDYDAENRNSRRVGFDFNVRKKARFAVELIPLD